MGKLCIFIIWCAMVVLVDGITFTGDLNIVVDDAGKSLNCLPAPGRFSSINSILISRRPRNSTYDFTAVILVNYDIPSAQNVVDWKDLDASSRGEASGAVYPTGVAHARVTFKRVTFHDDGEYQCKIAGFLVSGETHNDEAYVDMAVQCPGSEHQPAPPPITSPEQPMLDVVGSRPMDCQDILQNGNTSCGEYLVYPHNTFRGIEVYCDMSTDGGGWLVFQRRMDGSEEFYRSWDEYLNGFGNISGEFWMGNQQLHVVTSQSWYELRVELEDMAGNHKYATYNIFEIGGALTNYTVTVGSYEGDAGDALKPAHGQGFATKDKDTDNACASSSKGGWWYTGNSCHLANLNGKYWGGDHASHADGVNWEPWKGYHYSLKFTEMKIRRK